MDADTSVAPAWVPPKHAGLFKPGQSGNPAGRPPRWSNLKEYVDKRTRHGRSEIDTLYRISHDPKAGAAARISAANSLLDRLYGKPSQAVEVSGPDGGPVELRALVAHMAATLTESQLDALIAAKDAALVSLAADRQLEPPAGITETSPSPEGQAETVTVVVGE